MNKIFEYPNPQSPIIPIFNEKINFILLTNELIDFSEE
jgi:hypothetical protein